MPRFSLNSSRGLYWQPYGSSHLGLVLRRCTNCKPLTFSFPLVSSAASHSTQPVCRSDISSPQISHRQPDRMDLSLGIIFTKITVSLVRQNRLRWSDYTPGAPANQSDDGIADTLVLGPSNKVHTTL